jgi:universal stress protein E
MSTLIRTIVVGIALVDELDPLLPTAVRLAESIGATLHLVHVLPLSDPGLAAAAAAMTVIAPDSTPLRRVARETRTALRRQCDRFAGAPERIQIHVSSGSAHHQLPHFAATLDADLLIIGATRHGHAWRAMIGTTAERVLRGTSVPILVLHQPFFRPVERILLTTDLSRLSEDAHERGLDTVEGLFDGGAMVCTSVLAVPVPPSWPMAVETAQVSGEAEMGRFLAERRPRQYVVQQRVRLGDPASVINVEAEAMRADLIVLGTHGRTGLARFAFGSVAAATLRDATRNVLVIPAAPTPRAPYLAGGEISPLADPALPLTPLQQHTTDPLLLRR